MESRKVFYLNCCGSEDYTIGDTGSTNSAGSYCIAVLQEISGVYSCQLNFEDLPNRIYSNEWDQLTKNICDQHKKNEFLTEITHLIFNPDFENNLRYEKINHCFSNYFNCELDVVLLKDLDKFDPNANIRVSSCKKILRIVLWKEENIYYPIIKRSELHPHPEAFAQSILEDIRNLCLLGPYFATLVGKEEDAFSAQILVRDILKTVHLCHSVSQFIETLTELESPRTTSELPYGLLFQLLWCESNLSPLPQKSILCDLSNEIATCLTSSVLQFILKKRESTTAAAREIEFANEDLRNLNIEAKEELKKEEEGLKKLEKVSEAERQTLLKKRKEFYKIDGTSRLVSSLSATIPIQHFKLQNNECLHDHDHTQLIKLISHVFPSVYTEFYSFFKECDWSQLEIKKLQNFLSSLVNINAELDTENPHQLNIKAHHLSVALCLPRIRNFLSNLCLKEREDLVQINFIGGQSISIDVNLNEQLLHGVNLTFASNHIRVGGGKDGNGGIQINVSGLNGQEHCVVKPPTPGAQGTRGNDGLHGNPGENGGHVFIYAAEVLSELQNLDFISTGGKGGRGQDGGDGSNGQHGTPGPDGVVSSTHPTGAGVRHEYDAGKAGTDGKDGGDSGRIGRGGQGGFGGQITVQRGDEVLEPPDSHNPALTAGKTGDNGKQGNGGKEGKGGVHGKDWAWVTESAWWFDHWHSYSGHLKLTHHNTWFKRGCTVEQKSPRPDKDQGKKGNDIDEFNLSSLKKNKSKNGISITSVIVNAKTFQKTWQTDLNPQHLPSEVDGISHKLTELSMKMEKQRKVVQLVKKRSSDHEKSILKNNEMGKKYQETITDLDKQRILIEDEIEQFKEVTISRFAQQQQQQSYQITNSFASTSQTTKSSSNTNKQSESSSPVVTNDRLVYHNQYSVQTSTLGSVVTNFVLEHDNYKYAAYYESFVQKFLKNYEMFPEGAQLVLSDLKMKVESNQKEYGGFEIFEFISTIYPTACAELESVQLKHLQSHPLLKNERKIDQDKFRTIYNLFNQELSDTQILSECESFVYGDKEFSPNQKEILIQLLDPKIVELFIPKLVKAFRNVDPGVLQSMMDKANKNKNRAFQYISAKAGYNTKVVETGKDSPILEEERHVCQVLALRVLQISRSLRKINGKRIKYSAADIMNATSNVLTSRKDFESNDYVDEIFKRLLPYNLDTIVSLVNTPDQLRGSYYEFEFILENFHYDFKKLDEISEMEKPLHQMNRSQLANRIRRSLDAVQENRFQKEIVNNIFNNLKQTNNRSNWSRYESQNQLIQILNLVTSFEARHEYLEDFLDETLQTNFDWDTAIDNLSYKVIHIKSTLNTNDSIRPSLEETISTLNFEFDPKKKNYQTMDLVELGHVERYLKFSTKNITIEELIKIEPDLWELMRNVNLSFEGTTDSKKYLGAHATALEKDFPSFLGRNLVSNMIKSIRSKFDETFYTDCMEGIETQAEEMVYSTKILYPESYIDYLTLKLGQVKYWALRDGHHKKLKTLTDELKLKFQTPMDELECLSVILETLEKFPIPSMELRETLQAETGQLKFHHQLDQFEEKLKSFLASRGSSLIEAVKELIKAAVELAKIDCTETISFTLKNATLYLISHCKHDEKLTQFNGEESDEFKYNSENLVSKKELNDALAKDLDPANTKKMFLKATKNLKIREHFKDFFLSLKAAIEADHNFLLQVLKNMIGELTEQTDSTILKLETKCTERIHLFIRTNSKDEIKGGNPICSYLSNLNLQLVENNVSSYEILETEVRCMHDAIKSTYFPDRNHLQIGPNFKQDFSSTKCSELILLMTVPNNSISVITEILKDFSTFKEVPERIQRECLLQMENNVHEICELKKDKTIFTSLLLLENSFPDIFCSIMDEISLHFIFIKLYLYWFIQINSVDTVSDFWNVCEKAFDEITKQISIAASHQPYLEKYFAAETTNATRILISRVLSKPADTLASYSKLISHFQTKDNISVKEVITRLKALLTPAEKGYYEKTDTISLISALKESGNWLQEFEHNLIQKLFQDISKDQPPESKSKLEKCLTDWKVSLLLLTKGKDEKTGLTGRKPNLTRWMNLLDNMVKSVKILPISFEALVQFIQIASNLEISVVEQIIETRIPINYVAAGLLSMARLHFLQTNHESEVQDLMDKIERVIFKKKEIRVQEFLQSFVNQVTDTSETIPELQFFNNLFKREEFLKGSEALLTKLSRNRLGKWERCVRESFYLEKYNFQPDMVSLILEVETKFKIQTQHFLTFFTNEKKFSDQKRLKACLVNFKNGHWILNEEMLTILKDKSNRNIKLETLLGEFADKMRKMEVKGESLADAIVNLEMNSGLNVPKQTIVKELASIHAKYKSQSSILPNEPKSIENWTEAQITAWSQVIKNPMNTNERIVEGDFKIEVLAVVCQGVKLSTKSKTSDKGYIPRDTQLASVLLFLSGNHNGRLGEIATSEGKTLISAMLAVALALSCKNVDIITSSPVLAKEAWEKMQRLFGIFKISVSNICDDECRKGGNSEYVLKERYGSQVLYGDVASFQTDFLNEAYLGKEYKRGRRPDFLIVDEVDSMLLDKGSHVLYISHSIPELRHLRKIFVDIWGYVKAKALKTDVEKKIKKKYITKQLKFPRFLLPFVKSRIPIWINNAYRALEMKRNDPYILSEAKSRNGQQVTIIDLDTGVEQENMQYSFGLHQFLQLKHGNKISAESLKAVFVSNLGYFRKFKGKIFGITGTMGSEPARVLLNKLYSVDFFKMPRHRVRNCTKMDAVLAKDDNAFLAAILKAVEDRATTQPTLIICPTVERAKIVLSHLQENLSPERQEQISQYFSSYEDQGLNVKPLVAGDIIISTNLAGRGKDLTIDENCEDGMHVILTYIPPNRRIEKQAFGRTARAGKRGSTQYIIRQPEDCNEEDITAYQHEIDLAEEVRLKRVDEREVPQIELEEKLFHKFFSALEDLRSAILVGSSAKVKSQPNGLVGFVSHLVRHAVNPPSLTVMNCEIEILKNRWAIWLDEMQDQIQIMHINKDFKGKILSKFESFWSSLVKDYNSGGIRICKSSSDYVKLAKAYEDDGSWEKGVEILKKAIAEELEFNEIPHYYLGVCFLRKDSDSKSIETRKNSRFHFKLARKKLQARIQALKDEVGHFSLIQKIFSPPMEKNGVETESQNKNCCFSEQIESEIQLLGFHENQFLSVALGYPLTFEVFLNLSLVNQDEKEAEEIYEAIKVSAILQPMRVSKKIKIKNGVLQFNGSPLNLDETELKCYKARISSILEDTIMKPRRTISTLDLKNLAFTRATFWAEFEKHFTVANSESYTKWEIDYDEDKFIEQFEEYPKEQKIVVGKVLAGHNLEPFTSELMKQFEGTNNAEAIVKKLKSDGQLIERTYFKGEINTKTLKIGPEGNLKGLPKKLEEYEAILRPWIIDYGEDMELIVKSHLDTESLKNLPHEEEAERCDVVSLLKKLEILKNSKVNWSLAKWIGKEEKQRKSITSQLKPDKKKSALVIRLKEVFEKYHPDDEEKIFEPYLKSIRKELIKSVGLIKTLDQLKVDKNYTLIAENYPMGSRPPEIFDLINENFDRIPKLTKKVPWWCSGATWVTILGVVQIALGVTVGILSGGTLANVSMMLISEGGSDMMFAIQSGLTGSFSWKSYGIHKAFSVGASILTGGLAGITGASWTTIVLMELGEEILKKVAWTVGRYTLQGLGSTLLNMTIEKAMDWLRESLLSKVQGFCDCLIKFDQGYKTAKEQLQQSMNNFHTTSFRLGQVETLAANARSDFGVGNEKSAISNAFSNAMERVVFFYTSKLTDHLTNAFGKGLISSARKLYKLLSLVSPTVVIRCTEAIKNFGIGYINRLSTHFNEQTQKMRTRREVRMTSEVKDVDSFQKFMKTYMCEIDKEVVEEGFKKFQVQFAEPVIKQMGNRLLESKCQKMFAGKHADFSNHNSYSGLNQEDQSFWKTLKTPSNHFSVEMNSRSEMKNPDLKSNNNLLDLIPVGPAFKKVGSSLKILEQYFKFTKENSSGEPGYFELSEESKHLAAHAERLGVPIIRRFEL